jgi:hypothetical protein
MSFAPGARCADFFRRHPAVRDACLWAIPAILFGAALRLLLLDYSPYAYFGSDSKSYFFFAFDAFTRLSLGLDEKRRYIYPILLLPVTLLPGSPLKWLAWIQHGLGLLTLVPLAYCVRKTFVAWKWWIVPVTAFFAGLPMIIWYEHEMLGETVFFGAILWSVAGWIAWRSAPNLERARRLWWCFFIPFAIVLLTKPSGRFLLPGLVIALVIVAGWRVFDRRRIIAFVALILAAGTVGQENQGAWLLYTSAFPLTRIDTPKHAEYKAEIRDFVLRMRRHIGAYYELESEPFAFLEKPREHPEAPLFQKLDEDSGLKAKLYRELALEGIFSRPDLYLYIALQRVIASANPAAFKDSRFSAGYYPEKFEKLYNEFSRNRPRMLQVLFGLSRREPLPPYREIASRISPRPDSFSAQWIPKYVAWFNDAAALLDPPDELEKTERTIARYRPMPLGCWLVAGAVLALVMPRYRSGLGVWTIVIAGYLAGVFLIGGDNARYFGAAWPVMALWIAVPADALVVFATGLLRKRRG